MPEYDAHLLLDTGTVTAWDVVCPGSIQKKDAEERVPATRIVFPYRGVYVHSIGGMDHVAEPNQAIVLHAGQPFQVSHPVPGGDATLTVGVEPETLRELGDRSVGQRTTLHLGTGTQMLAAQLRQRLQRRAISRPEAETLALRLVRRALGDAATAGSERVPGPTERLANEVKLLLSTEPRRRWTLSEIAGTVNVSPVYLTDAFRRVEGTPLYRYQRRLRLALALTVLADSDNLADLAVDLGFHSHSHFSAAFKKEYRQTPSQFRALVTG